MRQNRKKSLLHISAQHESVQEIAKEVFLPILNVSVHFWNYNWCPTEQRPFSIMNNEAQNSLFFFLSVMHFKMCIFKILVYR